MIECPARPAWDATALTPSQRHTTQQGQQGTDMYRGFKMAWSQAQWLLPISSPMED